VLVEQAGPRVSGRQELRDDSRPPRLQASLNQTVAHAGEDLMITVHADSDTRVIAARVFGSMPVPIVWDAKAKANIGHLMIPAGLPSGTYVIQITAEDFAHNSSATELVIEVIGVDHRKRRSLLGYRKETPDKADHTRVFRAIHQRSWWIVHTQTYTGQWRTPNPPTQLVDCSYPTWLLTNRELKPPQR